MLLQKYEDNNADGINDRLIIEWNNVQGATTSPSAVTFQAILQLNTGANPGTITFNYPDLDAGNTRTNGGSATVGIKDTGTQGTRRLLVSFNNANSPYVATGKAIRFTTGTIAPLAARTSPNAVATVTSTGSTPPAMETGIVASGADTRDRRRKDPIQSPSSQGRAPSSVADLLSLELTSRSAPPLDHEETSAAKKLGPAKQSQVEHGPYHVKAIDDIFAAWDRIWKNIFDPSRSADPNQGDFKAAFEAQPRRATTLTLLPSCRRQKESRIHCDVRVFNRPLWHRRLVSRTHALYGTPLAPGNSSPRLA